MKQLNIIHKEKQKRFSVTIDGVEAHVQYQLENNCFDIRHTIVPKEIGGRGIASAIVEKAFSWAQEKGYKLYSTCSYATIWAKRHKINFEESKDAKKGNTCSI